MTVHIHYTIILVVRGCRQMQVSKLSYILMYLSNLFHIVYILPFFKKFQRFLFNLQHKYSFAVE